MAERRPLVVIGGQVQELPNGDTVPGTSGGGGSGSPTTPKIRTSNAYHTSSGVNETVSFPGTPVEGDLCIIHIAGGWNALIPSGWTKLAGEDGSQWNHSLFAKVLTSSDISTGSVTITMGGAFDRVVGIAVIEGSPQIRNTIRENRASAGTSSQKIEDWDVSANDLVLMFGTNRGDSINTCDKGAVLHQENGTNGSIGMFKFDPPDAGLSVYTFSYSTNGTGHAECVLVLRASS